MDVTLPTKKHSDFFLSEATGTAFIGGFGSGKSYTLITRMLATVIEYPTIVALYVAPTYSLIRDVLYPLVEEILDGTGIKYRINKAESTITVGKGRILCRSGDNPGRLIGLTAGDCFVDELDTIDPVKAEDIWNKCLGRMRAKFPDGKKNQIYTATTPEGYRFCYKKFKKNPPKDYMMVRCSTYDNPHLPDGFIDGMKASYPPQLFEAYCHGKFVNLTSGSVYSHFDREKNHTDRTIAKGDVLLCSMDFNVLGSCVAVYVQEGDTLYLVEEFSAADTRHMVEVIKEKYGKHRIKCFPDATGSKTTTNANQSDIALLKQAGFMVRARAANPRIIDRVNASNLLFYNNRMFVNTNQCPETTDAFEQQVWDEKTGLPEKQHGPATVDDHIDAATYCPAYLYPIKRRNQTRSELPF